MDEKILTFHYYLFRTEREKCQVQERLRSLKREDKPPPPSSSIPIASSVDNSDTYELKSQLYQQTNEVSIVHMYAA